MTTAARRQRPPMPASPDGGRIGVLAICAIVAVAVSLASCTMVAPEPPTPAPAPLALAPLRPALHATPGPADLALNRLDVEEVVRNAEGGRACKGQRLLGGAGNTGINFAWLFTCQRVGKDRTIYFTISDALEAELRALAAIPEEGETLGGPGEPLAHYWEIHANAYVGTAHVTSLDGPGRLTILVSLDFTIP